MEDGAPGKKRRKRRRSQREEEDEDEGLDEEDLDLVLEATGGEGSRSKQVSFLPVWIPGGWLTTGDGRTSSSD